MIILLLLPYLLGQDGMSWQAWTLLVATAGLLWLWSRQRKLKKLKGLKEPPGPLALPIVGNILQMGTEPNKQFCKWTEKYGDIYQIMQGSNKTIIISDPKLCKEIFSNDPAFTGRFQVKEFDMYEYDPGLGMFASEGERWEVHRRFLLRQLRDFGFGKSSMQDLILDELKEVLSMFQKKCGTPISQLRETLRLAVVNSLWMVLSSQRFDHDDPELLKLANNTNQTFDDVFKSGGILLFMPWVKHIIPGLSGYTAMRAVIQENADLFEKAIEDHKKKFSEDNLNDFIDVYLAEMKKHENDPKSMFYGKSAERNLAAILFDMFFAGSDTTANTTAWSILYLCKFPEVQRKLQQEITEVTGDTRHVSVDDRPNMPYANATIDEILRFSSIVPDGAPHRAMADREFHGYFIPKDTLIQPNLYYIHHSKKLWGDPENFRPERFLSDNGKKYERNPNLMPFQVGRRQCAGETLARDTIFLYVTNIFQKFSIKLNPNEPEPSLESGISFFRIPLPHSVIMQERKAAK